MRTWWKEFRQFVARGNVIDLAVGIILGSAFTGIVNSLVKDILMPPIGLLVKGINFSDLYINLSRHHYPSLQAAQAAGAPTINYGLFLNNLINFFIVSLVLFVVVKQVNRLRRPKDAAPTTKPCPYCCSDIPLAATRCPHCTSVLAAGAGEQAGTMGN
ncbi:large conductance mechanosensitive channel protein MscL [Alicyclobacillus sp.]|uniref:large conductance mechanosensitive channel protein MscL n=1 Tax=Alicyclobacillus sp. TaxID=61169 RepID=UPI0025BEF4CB|nr:large conductance mechanosensitive channel protein MscL [Alicyclobacillus sp.]MCL6516751.1 large conductance mechanosensitive channel protein MscL [Alicyclobacillus sp.]